MNTNNTNNTISSSSGAECLDTGATTHKTANDKAQADLMFKLLSQKKITLGSVLENLGNLDQKLHTMLTKGLVMELGAPRYPHIYKRIENWANPIKVNYGSGEHVDRIATLNKMVEEEGLSVLFPFQDTEICAVNLVCSIETVAFLSTNCGRDTSRAQLQGIALGGNWQDSIEHFLLDLPDAPSTANTGNQEAVRKGTIGKAIAQPTENK